METHIYVSAELGMSLREARKLKGYRQEDLAVDSFLSTGTISKMERGSVHVSREKVTYLCEKLEVSLQAAEPCEAEEEEMDLSLKLLSIENHLNMISPEEAWNELRKIRPEEELHRVWIIFLKGRYYEKRGKKQQAKIYYLQVAELDDPEIKKYNLVATSYHALGRICFYEDQIEEALNYVEKGFTVYQAEGKRPYVIHFLKISQIIYLEKLNRNEEALILLDKLWEEKPDIESQEVLLEMYEMQARIFTKLSKFEQAIKIATEGLNIARINKRYDHASELWIALGESYSKQNQITNAEMCFQSALSMVKKMQSHNFVIGIYLKMGVLFQQSETYEKALAMFDSAVQIARQHKDDVKLIESLTHLGDYFLQQVQLNNAKQIFQEALSISKELDKKEIEANLLMRLAKCCWKIDRKEYYDYLDQHFQIYLSI